VSAPSAGSEFLGLLVVALAVVHVPLGDDTPRVDSSAWDWRVERVVYRIAGVQARVSGSRRLHPKLFVIALFG
jgi:K+-transporting ATPase ATPase A chain